MNPGADSSGRTHTAEGKSRIPVSTLLWLALAIAAVVAVAANLGELRSILRTLVHSRPEYIAATCCVQLVFILNMGYFYTNTFRAAGLKADPRRFLLLTSASYFINLVSHTTGLAGLGIFMNEARRNGDPASRASAAYLIVYALGYVAFFIVLGGAIALVYARGNLTGPETVAAAVFGTLFAVIVAIIVLGLRSEERLFRSLRLIAAPVNFIAKLIRHRPLVEDASIAESASHLYDVVADMRRRPQAFILPLVNAFAVELLSALALFLVARALNTPISFEVALVGYAFSLLFSFVAFTPAGLGFVEASLAVILISFGVGQANAIAVALVFRLFDFWLPVAIGALSLVVVKRSKGMVLAV